MMLESSLSDLRDAQGVALPFCPSLVRLLRLLQDFLFAEGTDNHSLWSEKVCVISHLKHIQDVPLTNSVWNSNRILQIISSLTESDMLCDTTI